MKKWMIVVITMVALIGLGVSGWSVLEGRLGADRVTAKEAEQKLLSLYPGTILTFHALDDTYVAKVETETGVYQFELAKSDGRVLGLQLIEPTNTEASPEPQPEETPLTEAEATEIALREVDGQVDDVDTGESNGEPFFLVEIERDDGEAVVQVHAITGEIMTITWDE